MLALQLLNAAWTAVALSILVAMVQHEAPSGVTATAIGFGNVFWVCAGLCAVSAALLLARAGSSL